MSIKRCLRKKRASPGPRSGKSIAKGVSQMLGGLTRGSEEDVDNILWPRRNNWPRVRVSIIGLN